MLTCCMRKNIVTDWVVSLTYAFSLCLSLSPVSLSLSPVCLSSVSLSSVSLWLSYRKKPDRRILHCLLCETPQETLATHLARVCMKNGTSEERQAEVQRAKDSAKEWTRHARNWDYKDMCVRYPHTPSRMALLEELLSRKFFVKNCPQEVDLEPSNEPSTSATATEPVPFPASSGAEAVCTSSNSSDDAGSHDSTRKP